MRIVVTPRSTNARGSRHSTGLMQLSYWQVIVCLLFRVNQPIEALKQPPVSRIWCNRWLTRNVYEV